MNECIDLLSKVAVLFTLDASSRCFQIVIESSEKNKTAFLLSHDIYRCIGIYFGLRNAPGNLTHTMDASLLRVM